MPTRTYLTTPPGREPSEATGRSVSEDRERYVPGPSGPSEPAAPSRWRGPLLVLGAAAFVALILVSLVRASTSSQAQDPSLGGRADDTSGAQDDTGEGPTLRDGVPSLPADGLPGEA
ncbi:MAG: hypothetical protein WEB09_02910 [Nitriliruptor sp.]